MYDGHGPNEKWCTLVHVCRRWRNLTFTSPRHLNLALLYRPFRRSVKEMLDVWPELPINISLHRYPTQESIDNVIAALRLNHRVSGIDFGENTSDSAWERFVPLMQQPLPGLTRLWIRLKPYVSNNIAISRSFLGGSAPSLRDLLLVDVPFPALPELLLSATNLVCLRYNHIPRSVYISPQAMITGLSALTRLESLSLIFRSPQSLPDRVVKIPPPHTRILLPALTDLRFEGAPEYMEHLVAQIDAPLLESMDVTLLNREILEVSELAKFVRRVDKPSLLDRARVTFNPERISVMLLQEPGWNIDPKTVKLSPKCLESDLRFSYLARFCASCFPTPSPFESLHICVPHYYRWKDIIDNPDPQWLELLCLFNSVKKLYLSRYAAPRITQVLRGLPAERVLKVLPALEKVHIARLEPLGPLREAISEFADARQLSGHPVFIDDWWGGDYI